MLIDGPRSKTIGLVDGYLEANGFTLHQRATFLLRFSYADDATMAIEAIQLAEHHDWARLMLKQGGN